MVAYIDESVRAASSPGFYLVVGAVVDLSSPVAAGRQLREALGKRRQRFHWRTESEKVRLGFLDAVAVLRPVASVAVADLPTARRQEKARECALWALLPRLEGLGVNRLVFEAREESLNRRDGRTIGSIQRAGLVQEVSFRFGFPKHEPLLWVADALAGALSAAQSGDRHYVDRLPPSVLVTGDAP